MLSGLFAKKEKKDINWIPLTAVSTLDEIDQKSKERPALIFKHSTRCSISSMVINNFERSFEEDAAFDIYYLDLIAFRDVSNEIEARYGVMHQSPQIVLISNGKSVLDASHTGITYEMIKKSIETL